jgi:hypothetical protein
MNRVLLKKRQSMQKNWAALNRTNGRREWQSASSHSKLLQNDFVFCDVCCSMNEESALEKCRDLQEKHKQREL